MTPNGSAALPASALRAAVGAALLVLTSSSPALGQPILGIGSDAVVLPRGVLRVSVGVEAGSFDERYSSDADGSASTTAVPFRTELARPLDAAGMGLVGDVEGRLRALTGATDLSLSLGALEPRARGQRMTMPVRLELGLGSRLQLSAMIPYVRTRVVAYPAVAEGASLGINPAFDDPALAARATELLTQFEAASARLETALAGCTANPLSSPACADPEGARATDARARSFAAGLAGLYLPDPEGSLLVPVAGTAPAAAVGAQIDALRAAYAELGVDVIAEGVRPANAAPPTLADYERVLADPSFVLNYGSLTSRSRYGVGDVEIGARLLLVDGFGEAAAAATTTRSPRLRATATALVRLGTGATDDPNDLLDVGIGDGQHDVELGLVSDLAIGRAFVTVGARYGVQMSGDVDLRVPAAGEVLPPAASLTTASRDPGDYLEVEVTPRWAFGRHIAIGAQYRYRSKGADTYGGLDEVAAEALGRGTEAHEHRLGAGVTLSTLSDWARRGRGVPLEVSYLHSRTIGGAGMLTERESRDEVMVRVYVGLFGSR
ncbi:MAG TPA: hypothetical protein VGE02_04810 [Gemmatimonadales bacterium]